MRRILLSVAFLLVSVVAAMAQVSGEDPAARQGMMGGGMMGGGMMGGGMMGSGMMGSNMMKSGGMSSMMPCGMMGQISDGTVPARARGCFGITNGMMTGSFDLQQLQAALGLSPEQADKLKAALRPVQKEVIQIGATIRVAYLDLADLLSADKADLGKVEGKLKELESLRTKIAMVHIRASEEVKKIVSREQLEKFQETCRGCRQSSQPSPAPPRGQAPRGVDEPPPEHHPAQ